MDVPRMFEEVLGLSVFIFALVAQLKQFGLVGKALTFSAYGGGLVFGGLYRFFVYHPATGADWFFLVIFGMIGGFVATGAYKGLEAATGGQVIRDNAIALDHDAELLDLLDEQSDEIDRLTAELKAAKPE